jgi:enoyl-CoA hydratase/carnithine racemase
MTQTSSPLLFSLRGHTATITLDNPARHNALGVEDIDAFIALLDQVASNPTLRVLIVTGSGDKTFCAGAALGELSKGEINGSFFAQLTNKLAGIEIPTICALNGSAYGGGAELALCCDFRVGVDGMKLMVPAARFGLCYPVNGIERYVQRLGLNMAKRILLATEQFNAAQLLASGYLTHLVEAGQLQHTTDQLAQSLCALAPMSLRAMKHLCDQAACGAIDHDAAQALIQSCSDSADLREGLLAKSEKRTPVFHGN